MLPRIGEMLEQVAVKMGCKILEFSGEADHVHLLLDFHPRNSIAAVVSSLKAATSRMVKKEFAEDYAKYYCGDKAFWSGSYYVASVGGAPLEGSPLPGHESGGAGIPDPSGAPDAI